MPWGALDCEADVWGVEEDSDRNEVEGRCWCISGNGPIDQRSLRRPNRSSRSSRYRMILTDGNNVNGTREG